MNKENAIKKINSFGNIGNIIAIVANVFICLVFAAILIGTITIAFLPKDLVDIKFNTSVDTLVDLPKIAGELDESTKHMILENINSNASNGSLNVNGESYAVNTASFEGDNLKITTETKVSTITLKNVLPVMYALLVTLICAFVSVFFTGKLFKAFKLCSSPFDSDIIKSLQRLAYSIIPLVIMDSVINAFGNRLGGATNVDLSVNITAVFVVLVILALSYIFKYGAVLQQESDETL